MSKNLYFALDQAMPEPGCKFSKTESVHGWEYGTDIQCGPSYYIKQPYVFAPLTLVALVLIVFFIMLKVRKQK